MKKPYVLSVILAAIIMLSGCMVAPVKKADPPSTVLTSMGEGIYRLTYRFALYSREYYFRHGENIDYSALVEDMMEIDGVQSIGPPKYYELDINIARSYTWAEIEPQILELLRSIADGEYAIEEPKPDKTGGV